MSSRPSKRWSLAVYEQEVKDLEQDKIQTTHVTKESVESTRRMLQMMSECEDAGVNTLRMLNTQGEALNRTEGTLDEMENDLTDSGKTIKRISRMNKVPLVLLPMYLMFKSKPPPIPSVDKFPSTTALVPSKDEKKSPSSAKLISKPWWLGSKGKINLEDDSKAGNDNRNLNNGRVVGSLGKNETENTDRFFMKITEEPEEDEIESNLGVVSKHLHELKGHAIQIGSTVEDQNSQIDRIHNKAENNEKKIDEITNKTKKLVAREDSSDGISSCFSCVVA